MGVKKLKIIDIENEKYPKILKSIKKPPQKLYVLGNENILDNMSLSIVGSRNASEYGKRIARSFSKNIAMQGINIVSGMAYGIDSEAHIGAIEGKGKTVAVLGSGFNHIFPDKKVYEKILNSGGTVITEYEPDVDVFSDGFRQRNRIVAGLSLGTLIIEAKEKSGTGITAEFAKKFNRKIFCIPHIIGDKHGAGTNKLLKRGAILVTEIIDIIKYYEIGNYIKDEIKIEIPENLKECYDLIDSNPISVNQICKITGKDVSEVNTILTMLELEGLITGLPGNFFCREN